jgi:predicted metal-dependent peptidase
MAAPPPHSHRPAFLNLPEGLAAEEYYRLLHRPFDTGNLTGEGVGNATEDCSGAVSREGSADLPDDHELWAEADGTSAPLAEEVVRTMVGEAYRKSRGEVPGELRALVEEWLAPSPISWRQVLRQFVATAGRTGKKSTWKREHRRFGHDTPGARKHRRLHLLVGVDVSDSTDQRPLREAFARELVQMARSRESVVTVLYAGSRIQRIDSFRGSGVTADVYEGGGFTDLRPVFAYARAMTLRPAAVIYLTDGYGPAPERMEFPTLWVLSREGKKPVDWGVELRLDI